MRNGPPGGKLPMTEMRAMPPEMQEHLMDTLLAELRFGELVQTGVDKGYCRDLSDYRAAVDEHAERFSTRSGWGDL